MVSPCDIHTWVGEGDVEHQGVKLVNHPEHCTSVFAAGSAFHLTSEFGGKELGTVAYAEEGEVTLDGAQMRFRSIGIAHGGW